MHINMHACHGQGSGTFVFGSLTPVHMSK